MSLDYEFIHDHVEKSAKSSPLEVSIDAWTPEQQLEVMYYHVVYRSLPEEYRSKACQARRLHEWFAAQGLHGLAILVRLGFRSVEERIYGVSRNEFVNRYFIIYEQMAIAVWAALCLLPPSLRLAGLKREERLAGLTEDEGIELLEARLPAGSA